MYVAYTLGLLFLLVNCQNDTITEMQQEATVQKQFPYTASLLSKQEVEVNSKLSNQMRSLATLQSSNIGESMYSETYNFTVYTDVVNFVESMENNSHSYTFPINRENYTGNELENLVFSYDTLTDDYNTSLVTYHFTSVQYQEFLLTRHVTTPHEITYEPIAVNLADILGETSMPLPCTNTYTVYHITPGPNSETFLYSTNGNVQNACQHENGDDPCDTYTVIEINCSDSGSGSGSGTDDNTSTDPYGSPNNTPSGGGNGNTDNTNDVDLIVTEPILMPSEVIERCLNVGFDNPVSIWLNSQDKDVIREINSFLTTVGCNEISKQFIIEAIEDIISGDVDNFHEFVMENVNPDCESFNFSRVGTTNWQCASVAGVHELFTLFNWDCIGMEWGIFTQPLYFQFPINVSHPLQPAGISQTDAAIRLDEGFRSFDRWYQQNGCNTTPAAMTTTLLDYIKVEFQDAGGTVTTTPPLGFTGTPTLYQTSWYGYGNCL